MLSEREMVGNSKQEDARSEPCKTGKEGTEKRTIEARQEAGRGPIGVGHDEEGRDGRCPIDAGHDRKLKLGRRPERNQA